MRGPDDVMTILLSVSTCTEGPWEAPGERRFQIKITNKRKGREGR